ncbi:MAG: DUF4097 family beta strand repeat-containing protein [Vicinamibacterales bacterium]
MWNTPRPAAVYGRMNMGMSVIPLLCGALGAGCVVTVDSQSEIVREEKRFTVTGTADLRVTTFDGSIQIRAWDKPDVLIEIEKRGPTRESIEGLEIKAEQAGNVIEFEVKKPRSESFRGIGMHRSASARLTVSVPRTANIRARSGDGSITIERVAGTIELRTGDGSIRSSEATGDLAFDTSDGSVTVEKAEGRLAVETGDGSVSVSGRLASMKLHSGDGSVVFRADPDTVMAEDWEITTGDGSVSVYLPDGFGGELDAHTGDGSVRSDLSTFSSTSGDGARRTLRGRIGAGGKLLRIRTGDGAIKLRMN